MDKNKLVQQAYEVFKILTDDGTFPNNAKLPLVVYKGAFLLRPDENEAIIEKHFADNNWTNSWTGGVYDYHHYHSLTHEVMGVYCGTADLQLGGPEGVCVELTRGDVIIIPAGVAHKKLQCSHDFSVVGAYPDGREYDMNLGKDGERPKADENIAEVPLPSTDPVYGTEGPVAKNWSILK